MGVSRLYLDSYYLLGVVFKEQDRADAERILYTASTRSFEILIPQVVLGEAVSKILERMRDDHAQCMMDGLVGAIEKYKIDVKRCLVPASRDAFAIMEAVRRKDERLDGTDIMILAHALSDPDAKFFLTPDRKMANSRAIKEYEKELRLDKRRNEELKITDRIGSG